MVSVVFKHEDETKTWTVHVEGAETELQARQAFSAVVLTCLDLNPELLPHTVVKPTLSYVGYEIIPVRPSNAR